MSKKRFSEGLDDLFSDSKSTVGGLFSNDAAVAAPVSERRGGHKNFMSDLDSLLQEALEESLEKYETNRSDNEAPSHKSKSASRETSGALPHGLDALIRQTIDFQDIVTDENTGKRRLTVAMDKTKIEKLKAIARLENAYMKDLLVALIDEYIEEYSRQKKLEL
jgi:hypothetical protein